MADSFYIGAYWSGREETLKDVKRKVQQTLNALSAIDEQFLTWYETGTSRKQALTKKVLFDDETIERLCLSKVRKGELDDAGISKMGFGFSLWTGQPEGEESNISFGVGMNNKWLTNSCVLTIPYEGPARQLLLQRTIVRKIITVLIQQWKPDSAILTSFHLGEKLGNIGWITYKKSLKRVPKSNLEIAYEKDAVGHWIYPVAESFDEMVIEKLSPLKDVL